MKALSLWQPWGTLIARGLKAHETRGWATDYRGPLAIHAAKTLDLAGAPAPLCHAGIGRTWWEDCPRGAIVAVAKLDGCFRTDAIAWNVTRGDREAGNWTPGRWAWRLTNVRPLVEPMPIRFTPTDTSASVSVIGADVP